MDKDILLYCISKLVHQMNSGDAISPWVELTAHEAMIATNWRTNRESYQRFEDALDRAAGHHDQGRTSRRTITSRSGASV